MSETFETTTSEVFEVSAETRTIKGLVVPFGVVGDNGRLFTFSADTNFTWPADVSRVKLLVGHDYGAPVGYATALEKTPKGIVGAFKIARGAPGDHALSMAEDKVFDGLSMGLGKAAAFVLKDGVYHGTEAPISEVSLTPLPAFDDSRVTSVAASAVTPSTKEPDMTGTLEAPEAPDFTAITGAITEGFAALTLPPREVVAAGDGVQREALPYRFDGSQGEHGFVADIVASKFGASDAKQRLETFLAEVFAATTTANVAPLNAVGNRSELFVDALHYGRPLWNLVTTGTLDSVTAFTIPKFGVITGNPVSAHTQGTEPTDFSITATPQTITPKALSGKAILNREIVDQGGNPKVDQIVWNEMVAAYFDGIEVDIAAALAAVPTAEVNLGAGGTDAAKVALLVRAFTLKQFAKGGDRFSAFAADPTLYTLLTGAVDSTGRPLFPTFGPSNADGTKRPSLESVQVGAKNVVPAWALDKGTDNAELSYWFVPTSVYAWASNPRRIDIEYKVSQVEIGIWGYSAAAVTRDADVIPVDATTADV
jgi:HK97 family phage prohead protease